MLPKNCSKNNLMARLFSTPDQLQHSFAVFCVIMQPNVILFFEWVVLNR